MSDSANETPLANRDRYRDLVETNAAQLWTAKPDGGLDYVNPRVAAYAGMPVDLLLGNGWGRIVHPQDLARAVELWRHSLSTGETYSVEMRLQRGSDALYRWHLTVAEPVRDAHGVIIQWVGTNMDIDAHKRAVEVADAAQVHARKERERLRRVFQYAPTAVMLYRGPAFTIDLINPVAQAILGPRVLQGKPVREAFPEWEGQGIFEIFEQVYTTGEPFRASAMRIVYERGGKLQETFWDFTLHTLNDSGEATIDLLSHAIPVTPPEQ